jgi:hypothetical protein
LTTGPRFQIDKDGKIDFILAGEASKTNVQTIKLAMSPMPGPPP